MLLLFETRGLVGLNVAVNYRLQVAVQHLVEVVRLVIRAMIDDAVFREVVGANALGTVQRADL